MIEYVEELLNRLRVQEEPATTNDPQQKAFHAIISDPSRHLTSVFQPIINLRTQRIYGYEGLIRGPHASLLSQPDLLFNVAGQLNFSRQLDLIARMILVSEYQKYNLSPYLFLNATAEVIEDIESLTVFCSCLSALKFSPTNIVLEITEQTPVKSMDNFLQGIISYREKGFMFALDDLGAGYNGLKLWSNIQPEFIKIDKYFINRISQDTHKQHFLETIQSLSISTNTQVITEGIEEVEDLEIICNLGIPLGQGYLFAKPVKNPPIDLPFDWSIINHNGQGSQGKVAHILQTTDTLDPNTLIETVVDRFHGDDKIAYLPVVLEDRVLGMVWRAKVMDILASRYGRDLYANKPLSQIMDKNPIIVEKDVPVENLSRTITDSQLIQMTEAFIITDNQRYVGCGNLYELLRYITDLKIQNALYSNPLTGLPGNVPIQKAMQDWLSEQIEFSFLYIDLDNFKAFNDYYSFEQGDQILKAIATMLQAKIDTHSQFIGHIGGDDFVILSKNTSNIEQLIQSIFSSFTDLIVNYYREEDVTRGGIKATDREGNHIIFPIMSVSIGVIEVEPSIINHHQQLSSIATKAKKMAKEQKGNSFIKLSSSIAIDLNKNIYP